MLTSIEFVWKTEIVGNPTPSLETTKYDGYTEMTFVDSDPPETAHGSGFYIGFRPNAKKFNFWFARLTDLSIKILLRTVEQLQAQHHNAELTLWRAQTLLKTPAGQQSSVDAALASERAIAAQIAGAQAQLRVKISRKCLYH